MTEDIFGAALRFLEREPFLNMCMTEALRRGNGEILCAAQDGVLLYDRKSRTHMLSAMDRESGERLVKSIRDPLQFLVLQDFCIPMLKDLHGFIDVYDCVQAVYSSGEVLSVAEQFSITVLGPEFEEIVLMHYHTINSGDYIRGILERGEMLGAFLDGELAGFIGMHEEGSMGLLEVLPSFRRRGIGMALESALIRCQLSKGWTPFCHIFADNEASLALQRKLGLSIVDQHVFWVF